MFVHLRTVCGILWEDGGRRRARLIGKYSEIWFLPFLNRWDCVNLGYKLQLYEAESFL